MSLNIKVNIANKENYGALRSLSDIKYLVIHYTGNDGDSDESNANYFKNNIVQASAHYFVDDNSITQSVPDHFIAYSVGGHKYPNTKGAKYYGKCTNNNSINVELCDSIKNGRYDFTENTINLAVKLCQNLMKKYNIPIERVIRHYDVNGKICPKPFVEEEGAWNEFKERLVEVVETSKMIVDNKEVVVKRILKDGTNYIAIRDVAETMGYSVSNKGNIAVLYKK